MSETYHRSINRSATGMHSQPDQESDSRSVGRLTETHLSLAEFEHSPGRRSRLGAHSFMCLSSLALHHVSLKDNCETSLLTLPNQLQGLEQQKQSEQQKLTDRVKAGAHLTSRMGHLDCLARSVSKDCKCGKVAPWMASAVSIC